MLDVVTSEFSSAGREHDDIARGSSERAALAWIDIDYIARATRAAREMTEGCKG